MLVFRMAYAPDALILTSNNRLPQLMQRDIEQIEEENNEMEIQAQNHQKLADELKNLTV